LCAQLFKPIQFLDTLYSEFITKIAVGWVAGKFEEHYKIIIVGWRMKY